MRKNEGIDCLGVVLAAAERVSGCGWKSFSVNPTELVTSRVLGAPVEGASGVLSAQLEISLWQRGDADVASYVVRPAGQRPKVCRKHPPMGARHQPAQGEK